MNLIFKAIVLFVLLFISQQPALYANDNLIDITELNKKADLFLKDAVYDSAIFYYQKSSLQFLNQKDYLDKLIKIANIYRILRNFDSVQIYINRLEGFTQEMEQKYRTDFFEFMHLKGSLLGGKGEYLKAIELINEAVNIRLQDVCEPDTLMAKSYNNLGTYYFYLGNLSSALIYYKKALELAKTKKNKNSDEIATYFQNVGIMYARLGNFDQALDYFNKNLEINKKILAPDDPAFARIYLNLGRMYSELSQYDKALQYSMFAEKLYVEKFGEDYASLGLLYINMGLLHYEKSDQDEAELYYNNALRIYNLNFENDHPNVSKIYNNLGLLYSSRKQYEKALVFYKRSLEISKDPNSVLINLRNIAGAYQGLNQLDLADEYYQKAMQKARVSFGEKHYEMGQSYKRYGEFLLNTGNATKAQAYFILALNVFKSNFSDANVYISEVYKLIGDCDMLKNEPDTALKNYQLALISNDFNFSDNAVNTNPGIANALSPINYISILLKKAKALASINNEEFNNSYLLRSLECYQLAMDGYENLKSNVGADSKLYLANATRESFDLAFRLLHELYMNENNEKFIYEAFEFAEKGKASVLLSAIKGGDAIKFSGIPENLQEMEKDLKDKISGYESLVYDEKNKYSPDSSKITLWEQKLFNLNHQHDSLLQQFEDKYPSYYSLKYDNSVSGIEDIRRTINDKQLVIEYVLTDSILFSFVVGKNQLKFSKHKIDTSFFNDMNALRYSNNIDFSTHGMKEYKKFVLASNRLYKVLFEDLHELVKDKSLIIVPDGKLGYLPFESLVTEIPDFSKIDYRNLSYLLRKNPISYTYSSSLLFRENIKKSHGRSLLAFAPEYNVSVNDSFNERGVNINSTFDELLYAQEEVSQINKIFKGSVFEGAQANETNFKNNASNYDIIHLAMHTIINDENPMQSKLIFSPSKDSTDDGYLNTYEIYGLDLKAQMAVLSACNTGSGKINRGEGIMSLARGFIYAGVSSIVMTLWEVEDKSGANIMTLFYDNLERGMSKDVALQQAKLYYLDHAPQLRAHPYFWAAYVDIGNTEPIAGSFLSRYGVYFYVTILLFAVWFVRNRRKKRAS